MIDLHTHILPGLDDGAETLEDSIRMAQVAAEDGITRLVATPHGAEWGGGASREDLATRVAELRAVLAVRGVNVTVHPGLEIYLDPDLPAQLESGSIFPLNDTRYLLVELPLQSYPRYVDQVFFDLQLRGYHPILAHPERNNGIQKDHRLLEQLVERGVLAQVTAGSLLGAWGSMVKKTAQVFVERRLVHIIASDAHTYEGARAPRLSAAVRMAAKLIGEDSALAMVERTPERILAGEEVSPEPILQARGHKSWLFWR
ncbi:MAG: hypothetical protein EPO21_11320 [Chloroflexota bacterium]|nr:MAG: hypothetical protein EPO21_11320 [Chloroflexota bacterium]